MYWRSASIAPVIAATALAGLLSGGCTPSPRYVSHGGGSTLPAPVREQRQPASTPQKKAAPSVSKMPPIASAAVEARELSFSDAFDDTVRDTVPAPSFKSGSLEKGIASFYGPGFNGRKTASGERFNMNYLTAAHRTLPFGTRVRVERIDTHRAVVVRINDRGPVDTKRIIDVSLAAARLIGLDISGTTPVTLEVLP
jgi:rare lipoprotein A (peptidoglycan hydrolase)